MELPILVETQPFIPAHEMTENQEQKVGVMGKSPIFAQLLGELTLLPGFRSGSKQRKVLILTRKLLCYDDVAR